MLPCGMLKQVKASGGWISMCTYQGQMQPFLSVRSSLPTSDLLLRLSGSALTTCFYTHNRRVPFPNESTSVSDFKFLKKHLSLEGRVVPTYNTSMNNSSTGIFSVFKGLLFLRRDACSRLWRRWRQTAHFILSLIYTSFGVTLRPPCSSSVTCAMFCSYLQEEEEEEAEEEGHWVCDRCARRWNHSYLPFLKVVNLWEVCLSHNCRRSLYLVQTWTRARELTPWSRRSRHRGKKEGNKKRKRKSEGAEGRWTPWGWKSCQTPTCTGGDRRGQTAMEARPGNASGESPPAGGDVTICQSQGRSSSSSFSCILSFLPYLNRCLPLCETLLIWSRRLTLGCIMQRKRRLVCVAWQNLLELCCKKDWWVQMTGSICSVNRSRLSDRLITKSRL